MFTLPDSLAAFGSDAFQTILKRELEALSAEQLPLQQGLEHSSYVSGDNFSVVVIGLAEEIEAITVKVAIFYAGVIAGCNCADDPTPMDETPEQCEIALRINRVTAETTVSLLY